MTGFLITFAMLAVLALLYAFWLRDILRADPHLKPFYEWIEPIEAGLWARSRTILVSRLYWLAGGLLAIYDVAAKAVGASGIDWQSMIPEKYHAFWPLFLLATGAIFEFLRRITSEPLEDKT